MADNQRMDLITARTVGDKTYFSKIGIAFKNTKGDGWSLSFEALPIPQLRDGKIETRVLMMPPKPKDQPRGELPDDDSVPF